LPCVIGSAVNVAVKFYGSDQWRGLAANQLTMAAACTLRLDDCRYAGDLDYSPFVRVFLAESNLGCSKPSSRRAGSGGTRQRPR